jgi:tRNA threonylcarbamoyladenosine biosynthesis protein TsaB
MKVCALDTSTARLGVSVSGEDVNAESLLEAGLHHTEHLAGEIERLLARTGLAVESLDLIVCVRGPGSFTGLRIGMALAKGLSFGRGIPLVSVPALDLYAYGREWYPGTVLPVIDARKKRVYAAFFKDGRQYSGIMDCTPRELYDWLPNDRILLTGPHARALFSVPPLDTYTDGAGNVRIDLDRSAADSRLRSLIELGVTFFHRSGPDEITRGPLYVRRSEAEEARDG